MADYTMLRCPLCKQHLAQGELLLCEGCGRHYPVIDGIPIMLSDREESDREQNRATEKQFYEDMFSGLKGLEDGHCIVYGHDRIYDFMRELPRGTLLEAGCGAGHHGVALSKQGFSVTSVDLTLNGLRQARSLARSEGQDISYICGDIKQLPFADGEFDVCFCSLVLHHFLRLDNLLQELARVTRRYFVAFEVSALDPISFVRFNVINPALGIASISRNQRALFPGRLTKILKQNGFDDFSVRFEDMHHFVGRAPDSLAARTILAYKKMMKVFPAKYSQNKFLLRAARQ